MELNILAFRLVHPQNSAFLSAPILPLLPVRVDDDDAFTSAPDAGPRILTPIVDATLTSTWALGQPLWTTCGDAVTPVHRSFGVGSLMLRRGHDGGYNCRVGGAQ